MRFPIIAILMAGVAWFSTSLSGQMSFAADMTQAASMRNQAVALARSNKYEQALSLCQKLAEAGYEDPGFWADYLTILSWAGKEKDMIVLAEKHYPQGFTSLPDYLCLETIGPSLCSSRHGIQGRRGLCHLS